MCTNWGSSSNSNIQAHATRNNRITFCSIGFEIYNQSSAIFGYPQSTETYGGNTIDTNVSLNVDVYGSGSYSSTFYGCYNWYGKNPPDLSKLSQGAGSYLYWNPSEPSDLWAGIPLFSIQKNPGYLVDNEVSVNSLDKAKFRTTGTINSSFSNSYVLDSLLIGIDLMGNNLFNDGKNFFINYLKLHPDNQIAYTYLYNCADDNTTPEIINFFNSLPSKASNSQKLFLSYLYLRQGNVSLAKKVNNDIISANPNTPHSVRAMLNNFYIALYNENDISTASEIFNNIVTKADLSTPMEIQTAENDLSVQSSLLSSNSRLAKKTNPASIEKPISFSLSQNYPNPFNPSTTIIYSLKDPGRVKLELFDMLGRKLRTLVDEDKQPGEYRVNFIGSNLASGVYIYRLTSGTFTQVKKMQLLK